MNTRIDRFKVKKRMEQIGIDTFEELAKVAELSPQTVYNSLDGYKWRSRTLDSLAQALQCDPRDILTVDGPLTFTTAPALERQPVME